MAITRLGLLGSAAAYPGFTPKSAAFEPNVILWEEVAYAAPSVVSGAYTAPLVTSVTYIPNGEA